MSTHKVRFARQSIVQVGIPLLADHAAAAAAVAVLTVSHHQLPLRQSLQSGAPSAEKRPAGQAGTTMSQPARVGT